MCPLLSSHNEKFAGNDAPRRVLLRKDMHAKLFIGLLLATSASALRATMRPASAASRPTLRSPAVFLQAEPEAAPAAADLPEGWQMAKDNDGDPYYYNLSTGENTYEKPGGAPDQYGNVYDDEVKVVEKPALSNTMRDRLINESRGLGADPNQKHPRGSNGQ